MYRAQRGKQKHGGLAHIEGMLHIHVVMGDGPSNRLPAFRFNLFAGARAAVVFGGHLRQQSVAQAESRVAKALETAAIEQFVIDDGAGDDDFRAPRTDAFNLAALVQRQAGQLLGEPRHLRAGDDGALAASVFSQTAGCDGQGGGGSRRCNHILYSGRHHARGDAVHFAGDESLQPLEFALARRIVAQEFIGETNRSQRQTHGVANVPAPGDREFAASASQVHH